MKKLLFITFVFAFAIVRAQQSRLSLKECLRLALTEQPRFLAEKIRAENGVFEVKASKSALGPQISLTYAYKYNAIIPTSLVPVALTGNADIVDGLDDFTELQFGTTWQQDFGVSLFQPIFDKQLKSKIEESRINQNLSVLEQEQEKEKLIYEVVETYISLSQKQLKVNATIIDTLRTYKTVQLIKAGYEQGRILKSELNTALINHNNSKSVLTTEMNEKYQEQIHLGFLIGFDLSKQVNEKSFDRIGALFTEMETMNLNEKESINEKILKSNDELLVQKISSNKMSRLPTVALDAFWGANQFNQNFEPFERDAWFGNSFVGISLKLPILSAGGTKSEIAKLRGEREIKVQELLEEENRRIQEKKKSDIRIQSLKRELQYLEENMILRKSNLSIFQARFSNAKINAYQLNEEELLFQKSAELLYEKQTELCSALLRKYKIQGNLEQFLN